MRSLIGLRLQLGCDPDRNQIILKFLHGGGGKTKISSPILNCKRLGVVEQLEEAKDKQSPKTFLHAAAGVTCPPPTCARVFISLYLLRFL